MASDGNGTGDGALSPDEAFAVLGNDTRMAILRALGEAEKPLSFSELRDRVGMGDSGQFNYHLDRLEGQFVRDSGKGYGLRQAGRRVIEAVLSGAVTESPRIEPTRIDQACPHCGARIAAGFHEERLELFCPDCEGMYTSDNSVQELPDHADYGYIGGILLPPAGVQGRTPAEMTRAAITWANLEFAAGAAGVCPRCSARFDQSITACESHEAGDGLCGACGRRYATLVLNECTTCNFEYVGSVLLALLDDTEFLSFLIDHGVNPVTPSPERYVAIDMDHEEELLSLDPFEGRFTFTVDGDALTVTLDDGPDVVGTRRHPTSE
ncbi:MAG: ArsR/SmtB family transcription factor [Halobacteriales archaeon]